MADEALLAKVRERIVRFAASRLTGDAAEDIAQDVLVLLSTKYGDKTAIEDLMPLAFRITRLKMMAHRRKAVRRGEYTKADVETIDERGVHADSPTPEDQTYQLEQRSRLIAAMRKLTGRCRELFRLKVEGRNFGEIQREMGAASINTVYTWDARCRQSLMKLLDGGLEA